MDKRNRIIYERIDRLNKEYRQTIEPYLKIKSDIYNLSMPDILVFKTGVEYRYKFSDETKKTLSLIELTLSDLAIKYRKLAEDAYRFLD